MEYCKEQSQRDFKTQRALEKGKFISDEALMSIDAKIKTPNPAAALNVLQMQSSAANLQEQSSASSAEDLFPSTATELQKEVINKKVSDLSNKFKVFKQQHSNTGIGGPRTASLNFMYGRGKRRDMMVVGEGNRIGDLSNNDSSYGRAQTNSHDTTME